MVLNEVTKRILAGLTTQESYFDGESKRAKTQGKDDLAEWYDGMAHGLLRAKELIYDEMGTENDANLTHRSE